MTPTSADLLDSAEPNTWTDIGGWGYSSGIKCIDVCICDYFFFSETMMNIVVCYSIMINVCLNICLVLRIFRGNSKWR